MPDAYNPWGAPVFPTAADNAMQPETFVPQGVQQWTQQAAPKDYNILSQIAGSLGKALMYPGQVAQSKEPISTEDMVGPAFNLASMLTLGAGAAPQEANALNMGIKAYHGSPHDFDKFDLSKIGTGEGAQAYGHGLYFADNEGVAKSYRDALAGEPKVGMTSVFDDQPWMNNSNKGMAKGALQTALSQGKTGDEAVRAAMQSLTDMGHMVNITDRRSAQPYYDASNSMGGLLGKEWHTSPGHMYEVNINADPSHFLDWDKPLSPDVLAKVQAAAQNIKPSLYERMMGQGKDLAKWGLQPENISPGFTGENAVGSLKRGLGSDAAASQALHEAGIPGIKYLDEGSRNPWDVRQNQKGFYASENLGPGYGGRRSDEYFPTHEAAQQWADKQQTRNYVVFNHDIVDIMRKYAVPGMLGAPILANALSEQKT